MNLHGLQKARPRRILVAALLVFGALVLLLAPETKGGYLLLALGISIELLGLVLKNHDSR